METQLTISSVAKKDVEVFVTLGAAPGCLNDVSKIPFITKRYSALMGSFILKPRSRTQAYAPKRLGFCANLSFGTPPLNCPTPSFPNGVNLFEFILNNAFQGANAQETVDISCVAGVNCVIGAYLGGKVWNAGPTKPKVTGIENGPISTNTGRVGVYPVGCDVCTGSQNPPSCPKPLPKETPQSAAICNVQRNAANSGGIVEVRFFGTL